MNISKRYANRASDGMNSGRANFESRADVRSSVGKTYSERLARSSAAPAKRPSVGQSAKGSAKPKTGSVAHSQNPSKRPTGKPTAHSKPTPKRATAKSTAHSQTTPKRSTAKSTAHPHSPAKQPTGKLLGGKTPVILLAVAAVIILYMVFGGSDHEDVIAEDHHSPYYIVVYTQNNTVRVLEKDAHGKYSSTVKSFRCSCGKDEDNNRTPAGVYTIDKRYDWREMFGGVYAQYAVRFYGNYLFHTVPYYRDRDHASLEMEEFEKLGSRASLGCVRLCVRDAKWIYDNCPNGTHVRVITDKDGQVENEPIPSLNYDAPYYGWDPTDPDPSNPYNNK